MTKVKWRRCGDPENVPQNHVPQVGNHIGPYLSKFRRRIQLSRSTQFGIRCVLFQAISRFRKSRKTFRQLRAATVPWLPLHDILRASFLATDTTIAQNSNSLGEKPSLRGILEIFNANIFDINARFLVTNNGEMAASAKIFKASMIDTTNKTQRKCCSQTSDL